MSPTQAPATLEALAAAIAQLPAGGDAQRLRGALLSGATLTVEDSRFSVAFAPALDACTLARAWGWQRPYAVSGDVHQSSWTLRVFSANLDDPYGKRIATEQPALGAWTATVRLDGRPQGPLPDVKAGASPAYDLGSYAAKIVAIRFEAGAR